MVGAKTAAESHTQRSDCFSSEWTILPECLSWAKAGMVYGAKALIRDRSAWFLHAGLLIRLDFSIVHCLCRTYTWTASAFRG